MRWGYLQSILLVLVTTACKPQNIPSDERGYILISHVQEPRLAGKAIIRGRQTDSLDLPGSESLSKVLYLCGKRDFDVFGYGAELPEGVAFRRRRDFRKTISCVADRIPFDIVAFQTDDESLTASGDFKPILGL